MQGSRGKSNIQEQEEEAESLHQEIGLRFKEELVKCYIWSKLCVVLKFGHFGK